MAKNLYKATVTMEVEVLITADGPPEHQDILDAAHDEARENWGPFGPNRGWATTPVHVTRLAHLPKDWENAQPYGDNPEDKSCLQILDDYVPKQEPLGEQQPIPGTEEADA